MNQRDRIMNSFNRASHTYNSASELQDRVAQSLAQRVLEYTWNQPTVLEVGCGTGGLTKLLLPRLPGRWIITDIAPAMVNSVRNISPLTTTSFHIMDGESPDLPEFSIDLIVSNLAAQWFENLPAALMKLSRRLSPRGRMILTMLGKGSLSEWSDAVGATGHGAGIYSYPTPNDLLCVLPQAQISTQKITMGYDDAHAFLKSLKSIGASVPREGHQPLPTPVMRQAMKSMSAPCQISYEILTLDVAMP
jgi:malonyl-CoA O-methyltransferase